MNRFGYSSNFSEDKWKCLTLKWNIMRFQFCFNSEDPFSISAGQWPFSQSNALLFQVLKKWMACTEILLSTFGMNWECRQRARIFCLVLLLDFLDSRVSCEAVPCNSVPRVESCYSSKRSESCHTFENKRLTSIRE